MPLAMRPLREESGALPTHFTSRPRHSLRRRRLARGLRPVQVWLGGSTPNKCTWKSNTPRISIRGSQTPLQISSRRVRAGLMGVRPLNRGGLAPSRVIVIRQDSAGRGGVLRGREDFCVREGVWWRCGKSFFSKGGKGAQEEARSRAAQISAVSRQGGELCRGHGGDGAGRLR